MSAVVSGLLFEVRRFAAEAPGADAGLLELEGRFRAPARRRLGRPALVAEGETETLEVRAVAATNAVAEPEGAAWRATFAVPVEALGARRFSLAVGRELLLELPQPDAPPDAGDGPADRHVRLAREANAQRRRADEARDAAGAALARAEVEREARERADAEADGLRLERDDVARRLSSVETELAAVRREHAEASVRQDEALRTLAAEHADALTARDAAHADALAARDAAHADALAARDAAAARAVDEGIAAARAEATEARRALKAARGDLEAARREAERERERAERAVAVVPRGYVPAEAPEPAAAAPPTEVADAPAEAAPPTARGRGARARATADPATADPGAGGGAEGARGRGARARAAADPATADPGAGGGAEGVRVLGARPARRAVPTPRGAAEPLPGSAAIGARHIEPGVAGGRSAATIWIARGLAVACIAAVLLALALLLGLA